ncbi:hypothetical protein DIURU_005273 [Diutina rugosa]|uniref:t-SNARE coiled-coil homology domain-containing protein n=1 Tax=Diutina rugosa TaxID=5481 RepID=A0A642UI01_DIURU|nr:uncharacterized protein DIURU_005273 [Diutina rugosa]KAA8897296.1 hypothetical protein DIURU_005273 [Diutina rugosa]
MDSFATYESDFELAITEAKTKLSQLANADAQARKTLLKGIESACDEAHEVLDQMGIEIQNLPTSQRSTYNTKLRQYRKDVEDTKSKLDHEVSTQDRHELFGSRYRDSEDDATDDQRRQLLQNNSSLERSSQRLQDSQRIALETERIGSGILNDLTYQRDQISGARNTLSQAESYVDRSVSTLKSMGRRLVANKFISYAIIAVLILLIFLVLASKFW